MSEREEGGLALDSCRVLDLTEGGANWCGRVLADLGADVIKVEPPGGSPTRRRGPFYKDEISPERSLYWYAYCLNKRGITLDLQRRDARELFRTLAATSDFVLESFPPGYLDGLGLGYETLGRTNPGLIMTSMTPFGQTGPYADYKATDIVALSMGGMQYISGDEDRPPARISVPQAELNAGAQGAAGSMIAFWHRQMTGEGQHVDVSTQVAVVWTLMNATSFPQLHRTNLERAGAYRRRGPLSVRAVYACKDGYVSFLLPGGRGARLSISPVVRWIEEEGVAPEFMKKRDWTTWDAAELASRGEEGVKDFSAVERHIEDFIATKTKAELYERAITDRILLAPCNTVQDICEDPQLRERGFWVDVHHSELRRSLTYLGPFIKLSQTPITARRRAPLIGEHNDEILGGLRAAHAHRPQALRSSKGPRSERRMAFDRVKVLDFTWVGVGPITTKYLADHGADVIHVESVSRADVLRATAPFKNGEPGINRSQFPANYNTSKYGLGLNMTSVKARELMRRIIRKWQPDIIAESFTPKVMREWGLDYESVKELQPEIIYFSTCQQGQTGPRAMYAGFGQLAAALAGFYQVTGWPDREPAGPYGAYADFVNPPNALAAIVAALEHRRRTGKGQHLDLSQYECATQFMAPAIMDFLINGRVVGRVGNRDGCYVPHGVYPCKDEERRLTGRGQSWCAVSVTSDDEWLALCRLMANPQWTQQPRFCTFAGRRQNEDELDRLLSGWTSKYEAHELMRLLQEAGVPAGAVQSQADLWEDPQLRHRDFFQWLDHTECGPMPYDGLQFLLSKTPGRLRMPHALIGEHNELVLREFVGLSEDELADLIAEQVLEFS